MLARDLKGWTRHAVLVITAALLALGIGVTPADAAVQADPLQGDLELSIVGPGIDYHVQSPSATNAWVFRVCYFYPSAEQWLYGGGTWVYEGVNGGVAHFTAINLNSVTILALNDPGAGVSGVFIKLFRPEATPVYGSGLQFSSPGFHQLSSAGGAVQVSFAGPANATTSWCYPMW